MNDIIVLVFQLKTKLYFISIVLVAGWAWPHSVCRRKH